MKRLACTAVLILALGGSASYGLNVSGTVNDSAGAAIPAIRVEVYDEDLVFDDLLEVVYANATGAYSSAAVTPEDDIYVLVKWEFQMTPASDYNNHVVRLLDIGVGSNPYVPTGAFASVQSAMFQDVTANVTIPPITMTQPQPAGLPNLVTRVQQVLGYIRSNKGSVDWSVDYDVPVHIKTDSFSFAQGGDIYVFAGTFNGTGTTFDMVTLFHEMGHLVHEQHGSIPSCSYGGNGHTINSEEQPTCAMTEGYASYIGQLVAEAASIQDPFYRGYRDDGINTVNAPANSLWRGDEGAPTGRPGNTFQSGEPVEGAFSGIQFGIHGAFGFETNFRAMVEHDPDHAFDYIEALVRDAGGAGAAKTQQLYAILQTHGIVYNRARFANDPFEDAEEPPDEAPPSEGNVKVINQMIFLRGKVAADFEEAGEADLGVGDTVDNENVTVGYKKANQGLGDAPSAFTLFTSPSDFGFFCSSIDIDTTTFGPNSGDGEWDLVIRAENEDQFRDNFLPVWTGDGNSTVNTDESYLKVLGTWYDKDGNPTTQDDGKVIVDNTAPKVESFKP